MLADISKRMASGLALGVFINEITGSGELVGSFKDPEAQESAQSKRIGALSCAQGGQRRR